MENKGRAQCLVTRGNKILMVKHRLNGIEYYCLPGGGIEFGETPEDAASRELQEECLVIGSNLKLISTVLHDNHTNYTYHADIGLQEPMLGGDPENTENPILVEVAWMKLKELCERDRAYLWAAGLFYIDEFAYELDSWGDDIRYPSKRLTRIELVQLSDEDGDDIYQMLQEIPQDENGFLNSVNGMSFTEYKEWLIRSNRLSKLNEIIDGLKVPSSTYWLYVDGKPVGMGKIRHLLTDKLREEGGHIGYAVSSEERNKGYGRILLKELLKKANQMSIDKILLTIRNENEYSLKVALSNGGVVEKRDDIRCFVWIDC